MLLCWIVDVREDTFRYVVVNILILEGVGSYHDSQLVTDAVE